MAKLKLLCVMWCVFFGWCSAAPSERTVLPAADQQTANTSDHQGHQNDTLLEELDSQENILTQVGYVSEDNLIHTFFSIEVPTKHCYVYHIRVQQSLKTGCIINCMDFCT